MTGTNPYGLSFVVFDKKSGTAGNGSSTIYVGVAATTAGTNLYRSTDAGATWTLVTGSNPPSGLMPHHGALASDGNLWIAYNSSSGPNSISSGAVWKHCRRHVDQCQSGRPWRRYWRNQRVGIGPQLCPGLNPGLVGPG